MSGPMPKHVEKAQLRVFDEMFRSTITRAETLIRLREWSAQFDGSDTTGLADCVPGIDDAMRDHLATDWFGNPEQMFWIDWDGDGAVAARIVAAGAIETAEVSFGLATGEPLDAYIDALAESAMMTPEVCLKQLRSAALSTEINRAEKQLPLRRDLPVDTYWICEMPLFEAYVSWNDRQVTMHFTTPAVETPMYIVHPRKKLQEEAKTEWSAGMFAIQSAPPEFADETPVFTALMDAQDIPGKKKS